LGAKRAPNRKYRSEQIVWKGAPSGTPMHEQKCQASNPNSHQTEKGSCQKKSLGGGTEAVDPNQQIIATFVGIQGPKTVGR